MPVPNERRSYPKKIEFATANAIRAFDDRGRFAQEIAARRIAGVANGSSKLAKTRGVVRERNAARTRYSGGGLRIAAQKLICFFIRGQPRVWLTRQNAPPPRWLFAARGL